MKSKINHYLLFIVLLLLHIVWLYSIREQIASELILPIWLLAHAKTFVSEITTMYPMGLFYLINIFYFFTENLRLSFYIPHITIIIFLDCILYFYLKNKFGFKNAVAGFLFYILWQVFFRGNFLWFDLATIPFIALSFFSFSSFIKSRCQKDLLYASVFLSLGFFFKNTTMWILIFYFIWVIILAHNKKPYFKKVITNSLLLITPSVLAIILNFLLLTAKSTLAFSFYWSIIMAYMIFPRISSLSRFIEPNYFPVIFILLGFYLIPCVVIAKFSKESAYEKWFLYIFPTVAFASIFPRWSDFRLQLFVFFLAIIFTYAISLIKLQSRQDNIFFRASLLVLFLLTFVVIGNRILIEIESRKLPKIDELMVVTQNNLTPLLKDKSIFVNEAMFFDYEQTNLPTDRSIFVMLKLMITDPDLFYRIMGPNIALSYIQTKTQIL